MKGIIILLFLCSFAFAKTGEWFVADQAKGNFVIVHGLNVKPSKMNSLANFLKDSGYSSYVVKLKSHWEKERTELKASDWKQDVFEAWNETKPKSELPTYLLGYSLGGLVSSILVQERKIAPEKMILLAPALSLKWNTNKLAPALNLAPNDFEIPSFSPKEYRAHPTTRIDQYTALFELFNEFDKSSKSELYKVKTLVFIDPDDELVSPNGLEEIANKTDNWVLKNIHFENSIYNHLIIDEKSLGVELWQKLKLEILSFLAQ